MNNSRGYVGVTGVTSVGESRACVDLWRATWSEIGREPTHDLMLGVLATSKTLAGFPAKKWARYPDRDRIADCFVRELGVLNLIHYAPAGAYGRSECGYSGLLQLEPDELATAVADDLSLAMAYAGSLCDGIQVNCPWPNKYGVRRFREEYPLARIVLQVGPEVLSEARFAEWTGGEDYEHWVLETWPVISRLHDYLASANDVLIDPSAGNGEPLDETSLKKALTMTGSHWRGGVSGGLCAAALRDPALRPHLAQHLQDGGSIDAETRLRDGSDGGGWLDLREVGEYLREAARLAAGRRGVGQ